MADPVFKKSLLEDGVVLVPGLLDGEMMANLRTCYDWSVANPGPVATSNPGDDEENMSWRDYGNPGAPAIYHNVIKTLPFAKMLKEAWESEHVWYHEEEPFLKKGKSDRIAWHQDTAYTPWNGEHWVNCWITFEAIPRTHSIEVVRSSHLGPLYNDPFSVYKDMPGESIIIEDPERPNLPDIEAVRKTNPAAWSIVSYDIEPGDVVFFHPACLHSGPATDEQVPLRSTLTIRFFGDKAYWSDTQESEQLDKRQREIIYGSKRGKPGTLYRDPRFLQLC